MNNDLRHHSRFSAFRTKQNVSKSKLGGEFAKKGWNNFSTGFSENTSAQIQQISFAKEEESIKKRPKIDPEVFKKQISSEKYKLAKRKPVIEQKDAVFFTSKAKDLCSLIQRKSLKSENQKDLITRNFNGGPNSVFLEVQNIQDSFQQTKSTNKPKFCIKYSSESEPNFIADLAAKKVGEQENVPKRNRASNLQFISGEKDFSHSVSVRKVQKTNIFSDLYSSLAKKNSTIINHFPSLITNSNVVPSYSKKNHDKIKCDDFKLQLRAGKVVLLGRNQNNKSSLNLTSLLVDESSENKGSSWLQSLQIPGTEVPEEETVGKKRIRNILPGGFAEQMLKLQRIEKSEEVIWDHNVDRSKRKAGKSLPLLLTSVSGTADLVIAKCLLLQTKLVESCIETINPCEKGSFVEVSTESNGPKRVVVLLKRTIFNKLHLKAQCIFHLYPPWQTLVLPLISCPIILCAKFIEFNNEGEVMQDKKSYAHPRSSVSSPSASISNHVSSCFNNIFYQWEQPISLSGRVQRIWRIEIAKKNVSSFISNPNHFTHRYSILIQEQSGLFYELVLSSSHCSLHFWREFISQAEGKCYQFHNLRAINRFYLKKHPRLIRVLDSFRQQDGLKGLKQEFYYQLAFTSCSGVPEAVNEEGFPTYCAVSVQPLSSLFRDLNIQRFTCICKVIFKFKKSIYLCDDSVPKYVQLESPLPIASNSHPIGSLVLIKEAQLVEGCLYLDQYSSLTQLPTDVELDERTKQLCKNGFSHLANISLQSVIPSISVTSGKSMFVFITGEVVSVDENNALSWLQCNLCFSENLVQDSNLVIYCENCLQIVPKAVLNVKMSVMCQCSPNVKVNIELLSRTTKEILQIDDDTHQPQCNVGDVLGKCIGPLFCCINNSTNIDGVKQFSALEIDPSQDTI